MFVIVLIFPFFSLMLYVERRDDIFAVDHHDLFGKANV